MESIGDAARRLLAKLDARRAREKGADGFGVMVESAASKNRSCRDSVRPDRPHHRDDDMGEDRAVALPVKNEIQESAMPQARGREGQGSRREPLPVIRPANDDKRDHARPAFRS